MNGQPLSAEHHPLDMGRPKDLDIGCAAPDPGAAIQGDVATVEEESLDPEVSTRRDGDVSFGPFTPEEQGSVKQYS